ncbi:MAG: hypothetical protein K0V04_12465 [Deltaproteobacteria bacterium]|nr:hypothetical protein [Deltaproteobacteria bacterium]
MSQRLAGLATTWQSWGNEECMAWHTPMVYSSQRPVAWTQGEFDTAACSH